MFVSEQGIALIRQYEGFSATAYWCPAGKMTIGYGHVIGPDDEFADGCITTEAALSLLEKDIGARAQAVFEALENDPTQNQFDAMVSLAYNIGVNAFVKSTLLRLYDSGDIDGAERQFAHWAYVNGQKLPGLENRRLAEAALFSK